MEIYLIRHTTPLVEPGQIYGWSEVSLAPTADDDIEKVLGQLPAHFDCVYSSPSIRCTVLAKKINADFIVDERLRELNFGEWEGKTWNTIDRISSQIWMDDFVNQKIPGGESMLEMRDRICCFWNELRDKQLQRAAIITHAGVIRILLALHQDIELDRIFTIKVGYGEIFYVNIADD